MDDDRRAALFDDAINRPFTASSFEALLAIILSWVAGAGLVALLTWWLSKPLSEAPVAYAIVFGAASLTFVFNLGFFFVGQQIGDLARAAKAIALSRRPR